MYVMKSGGDQAQQILSTFEWHLSLFGFKNAYHMHKFIFESIMRTKLPLCFNLGCRKNSYFVIFTRWSSEIV